MNVADVIGLAALKSLRDEIRVDLSNTPRRWAAACASAATISSSINRAPVAGGEDRGPSPLDVLVISVGACAHCFAAAYLRARGISAADLTVEVESEKDQTGDERKSA